MKILLIMGLMVTSSLAFSAGSHSCRSLPVASCQTQCSGAGGTWYPTDPNMGSPNGSCSISISTDGGTKPVIRK